ncbi:MAG: hypothetical protein JWP97_4139 [Labilithrix sp.]|nr:hypothetical protein [Labilithrix sp.]
MDIVAILALGTSVDDEAPHLAAALGLTAYEAALALRAPCPTPVLRTEDRPHALAVLAGLRSRGHDAVACDSAAVATGSALFPVRAFTLTAERCAVTSLASGAAAEVRWDDVVALVRGVHRSFSESLEKGTTQKLSLGRAALSGGLMMTKKVSSETKHTSSEHEPVLYVFRRSGAPLLFQQSRVRYDGLGPALQPSQLQNFATLVRLLREHAPRAPYDERLVSARPSTDRVRAGAGGSASSSTADSVDLLAHLVALSTSRASPYR